MFLSESLPDEDPETQAVLVQRVLEIIMEVENLTVTEKAVVQGNLTSIRSHTTTGSFAQSSQLRYVSLCSQRQ
jgi:hypothetical protein